MPGSGNFSLLTETPIEDVVGILCSQDVTIVEVLSEKLGAIGKLMSVCFHDLDNNLVEVIDRLV